jgi:hypothetical protein
LLCDTKPVVPLERFSLARFARERMSSERYSFGERKSATRQSFAS